jgi:hypothetical protein
MELVSYEIIKYGTFNVNVLKAVLCLYEGNVSLAAVLAFLLNY